MKLSVARLVGLATCLLLRLAAGVGVARGEEPAPVVVARSPESSWSVRGDAFVLTGAGGLDGATRSLGLTVQKILFVRWAWEETVAWGLGNRAIDGKDLGLNLAGTLRFAPLMNDARTQALTLGLGTAFIFGGGYGHLHFVYSELGYAYRGREGLNVLVAVGPDWLYAASNQPPCPGNGTSCVTFRAGDFSALGHVRAGLGWSF